MNKGKIIYLNGVSSSGKSTLAKALQDYFPEAYYLFSVDAFMHMSPAKCFKSDKDEDEDVWLDAIINMYHTIKMYSDKGYNVIVDDVFDGEDYLLNKCLKILWESPVTFVHVTCPVEALNRREKERGDREIGLAESQLSELYPLDNTYDVTVDTHLESLQQCCEKISDGLNSQHSRAFSVLYGKLANS